MNLGKVFNSKTMGCSFRCAEDKDLQELLTLYFTIYGNNYPLSLGTDREVMKSILKNPDNLWLLSVDDTTQKIVASAVFEVETLHRIGRAEGLVVHPDFQRKGLASEMLEIGSRVLIQDAKKVNSIYTTTRTLSVGPQLAFLKDGYIPLGLFPNAHRLSNYETLTLMAKFNPEVLSRRQIVHEVPEALGPIIKCLGQFVTSNHPPPKLLKMVKPTPSGEKLEFDLIHAPHYVERLFLETFSDAFDRFYPFHKPNFLISAKNGEVNIFGYLSKRDGYCTLVATTQPTYTLAGRMRPLMLQLRDFGVAYLEILMAINNVLSLEALLDINFLPSAIYPAMLEYQGGLMDLVLMSRTMEPLNFRGIQIEKSFKPYIDQYVDLWKKMHLDVLGVFDDK
jgi:GNAT superfamily N-acetyltransferase